MPNPVQRPVVRLEQFVFLAIAVLVGGDRISKADDRSDQKETTVKARRLEQMRDRASLATIHLLADEPQKTGDENEESAVKLQEQPIFRYDDQPRGFRDAALWMWSDRGRPIAIGKIEDWRDTERGPTWITCLTSLAPNLMEVTWEGGRNWSSKKPGLQFQPIKDGPKPEATEAGRLRQFKNLAQKFTISMQLYSGDRQEMRLLPRHLHRYSIPADKVADAVVFGWTSNGTNPDAVLLIEQRLRAGQNPDWVFSLAPVTADQLWLKLDGQVVQHKAQSMYPSDDTLIFFFEKNADTID